VSNLKFQESKTPVFNTVENFCRETYAKASTPEGATKPPLLDYLENCVSSLVQHVMTEMKDTLKVPQDKVVLGNISDELKVFAEKKHEEMKKAEAAKKSEL
jgi:hypothetical protein